MRQFIFIFTAENGTEIAVTVNTDILEAKTEKFTIMDITGGSNNEFQKMFPWWKGSVITRTELNSWFRKFRPFFSSAKEYGDPEGVIDLGSEDDEKTLTITPTITSATSKTKADMIIKTFNSDGILLKTETIELTTAVEYEYDILLGYTYNFSLPTGGAWTGGTTPADITCDGDETLAAAITVA